jgi:hypothetical protein
MFDVGMGGWAVDVGMGVGWLVGVFRFCDSLLRKSSKPLSTLDLDAQLEGTMIVFDFLEDKDVFQKFYANKLAKRLVTARMHPHIEPLVRLHSTVVALF